MENKKIQVAGCAIVDDGKVLLRFKKSKQNYEFPGGKLEPGESLEQAAQREAKEEVGVAVEIISYASRDRWEIFGRAFEGHDFLARLLPGQIPREQEPQNFGELLWMPIMEYLNYPISSNVAKFCREYLTKSLA